MEQWLVRWAFGNVFFKPSKFISGPELTFVATSGQRFFSWWHNVLWKQHKILCTSWVIYEHSTKFQSRTNGINFRHLRTWFNTIYVLLLRISTFRELRVFLPNFFVSKTAIYYLFFFWKLSSLFQTPTHVLHLVWRLTDTWGDLLRKVPSVLVWPQQKNIFFLEDLAKMN